MPHDANGFALKVGDKVLIEATIKEIFASSDYCNCNVELKHAMPPGGTVTTFTINTRQLLLDVGEAEALDVRLGLVATERPASAETLMSVVSRRKSV